MASLGYQFLIDMLKLGFGLVLQSTALEITGSSFYVSSLAELESLRDQAIGHCAIKWKAQFLINRFLHNSGGCWMNAHMHKLNIYVNDWNHMIKPTLENRDVTWGRFTSLSLPETIQAKERHLLFLFLLLLSVHHADLWRTESLFSVAEEMTIQEALNIFHFKEKKLIPRPV